jgi:branched-chain amino acid transport system ATP-binding protein
VTEETLLSVSNLEVAYGDVQVIWGISFRVAQGEIVTLIGPNGAGKTSTLWAVSGLLPSRAGSIRFREVELTGLPPHEIVRLGVIQIPEGRRLWPRMTVEESLLLGAFAPQARKHARDRLAQVYELFPRLAERRGQLAGTLSGGEQQMCAIGRGLMADPAILMFDEPSLGLAPLLVDEVFARIQQIARQGVTILLVEQKVTHALEIADRGYVLETGQLSLEGTARELRDNEYVQRTYLGVT